MSRPFIRLKPASHIHITVFVLLLSTCHPGKRSPETDSINILLLTGKNYGLNTFLMQDVFDAYGWNIVTSGVEDSITACPPVADQMGIHPILPDRLVGDIDDISAFDGIVIPPSSGNFYPVPDPFMDLTENAEALQLISQAVASDIPVFAMCSGVRVLVEAGVVQGRQVTGAARFQEEYENAGARYMGQDHPPVIDGSVITASRGQFNNVSNCQAIAAAIESRQQSGEKRYTKAPFIHTRSIDLGSREVMWAAVYGGSGSDGGNALCVTSDGGLLIAGYTFSHGSGDADILIIKTDTDGRVEWQRTFGGRGTEYANACCESKDGYLIVGYTTSFGAGSRDMLAVRLDTAGNTLWSKTYGGDSLDVGTAVTPTRDGAILCGYSNSYGSGEEDVYLVRIDDRGNPLWMKTVGGDRFEYGNSIAPSSDGTYLVSATTGTYGGGNSDFYRIRIDGQGEEIRSIPHGPKGRRGYGFDWCRAMAITEDGGALLVGFTDSGDVMDAYAVLMDSQGDVVWSRTFGAKPFYDYANSAVRTPSGDFLVAGVSKSIRKDAHIYNNDFYLVRIDSSGEITDEKTIGGDGREWAEAIAVDEAGSIYILGRTDGYGSEKFDICLLKLNQ